MLSMEYLLEEAKAGGLPFSKKRAILREYLQIMILNSIYKQKCGKYFFFMGGTAMRYFYNLPRFSEDLDFNSAQPARLKFSQTVQRVCEDISKEGFTARASHKQRKNLITAEIIFEDAIDKYGISDSRGVNLTVKIEVNNPKWNLAVEPAVLSLYGYSFTAVLMSKGNLISEKMLALLSRKRGRDIYDILFMLKRGFPFNKDVLKKNNIGLPAKDTLLAYSKGFSQKELKNLAGQVRPFLFKEDDAELILKAPLYAEKFLENYS